MALAVFAPARVFMLPPRNITSGLLPSEKRRCLWNILTAPSSSKIMRHCLPPPAAQLKQPSTPRKPRPRAKNTPLTSRLPSDCSHLYANLRSRVLLIDRRLPPPLFCRSMNFTAHTHRHHHHGHAPRA